MPPRTANLRNVLRERVATWAHRNAPAELRANVRRFLGRAPATEDEARGAIAFALVTAPADGASLLDRFAAQAGHLPRAERLLFDEWARTRFSLLCVTDVEQGEWIEVHDVLADRALVIPERSGSETIDIGMWLAAFYCETDGRPALEGALSLVPVSARVYAVQGALKGFATLGVDPREAPPAITRRIANGVLDAVRVALRSHPDGPAIIAEQTTLFGDAEATPDDVTDEMFEKLDAAWPDAPVPALDGLTPRQAVAAGRRAEVWAVAAAPDGGLWASAEVLLRR